MAMKPVCLLVVFLLMLGCSNKQTDRDLVNQQASLRHYVPFEPLQWRVVSSAINKQDSTMSTLYGNDLAVRHARTSSQGRYPLGSVLSLVTWLQQDDKEWFGAKIPGPIKSIEFVRVDSTPDNRPLYSYQSYEGTPLKRMPVKEALTLNTRVDYILSQRASVMP
jgi:hypothetical protein